MHSKHITKSQIPQAKQLWKRAFGDEESYIDGFFETAFAPERSLCLEEGGQLLAALYWLDTPVSGQKQAYIYAVATHPDHRGKGLCRRLMEETHAHIKQQGYTAARLLPGREDLRQLYTKLGYQEESRIGVTQAEGNSGGFLPMKTLTGPEYAALREGYLPEKAPPLTGEALAFWARNLLLLAGEDFLLACHREGEGLFVPEFLGNRDRIAQITATLGCKAGTFRHPGADAPFTMWHPLTQTAAPAGYFPFVFD